MSKMDFLKTAVDELKAKDLDWRVRTLEEASTPKARVDGKEVIVLCSNNYLGLSTQKELKDASIKAIKKYGAGSGSVRAIAGTMQIHKDLEKEIAKFKGTQDSLYYQTGFTVNSGLIPALLQKGDLAISDELNHGSIIDGVRLSKADKQIYAHKDMADLEKKLKESKGKFNNTFIITDGVFSMDGDIAPLDVICELAEKYNAIVYVDDAHGDGVLGKKGQGIVHHFNVQGKVDIEMGTFSKAFGVVGGYICGSTDLKEYALNKSRTWLLTGSSPPAVAGACIASLQLLEKDESFVKNLWKNTKYYQSGLKEFGFDLGKTQTPITPIMLGESKLTQEFSQLLYNEGIFGLPIIYPMVAQGKARIRTLVTAAHKKEEIDTALGAFERIGKKLKVI